MSLGEVGGESGDLTAPGSSELQRQMAKATDPNNRHMGHRRDLLIHKPRKNSDFSAKQRTCPQLHGRERAGTG